jgi:hypothetical protein
VKDFHHSAPRFLACVAAQSIKSAVPSALQLGQHDSRGCINQNPTVRAKEE